MLTAVLWGSVHHFSDPPGLHFQGSRMKPWLWRWNQSLKSWCIWSTWHGCQPEKILFCTSMKGMPYFPFHLGNVELKFISQGPTVNQHLSVSCLKMHKKNGQRSTAEVCYCHNSAPAPCSVHACLLFWTLHTSHISHFSFFSWKSIWQWSGGGLIMLLQFKNNINAALAIMKALDLCKCF